MDPVIHFEMPYENGDRMANFYSTVFNWFTKKLGEEMGDYIVVGTSESDQKGTPLKPGSINGGFYPKQADNPAQFPSVVIAVNNINESIKKINNAGGKVLGEPVDIPGIGKYVSFFDTEGNRVSILQPLPMG